MTPPLHYPTRISSQESFQCTASSHKPVAFPLSDQPFPLRLGESRTPEVRQCTGRLGARRANEHGILDLRQPTTS